MQTVAIRTFIPNALALPGGRVYLLSPILQRANSVDELAGVIAHELGHLAHRDHLRGLIQNAGTSYLVGLLYGDVMGSSAVLFATRTLLQQSYSRDKEAQAEVALLQKLEPHLNAGKTANTLTLNEEEKALLKLFQLLTAKPVLFACNVAESDLATAEKNPFVQKVAEYVRTHHDAAYVPISAKIEAELIDLPAEEAKAFLKDLGVDDSGVSSLIRGTYALLGLQTYFTAGEKEVRAWTIKKGWKAPQAAGVIHTDFEKGFIKAEVVSYADLSRLGSTAAARDAGKYRLEGKEYIFADGDVALFRFNN